MKVRLAHFIGPTIAAVLFVLALRVLYRELAHFQYSQVVAHFSNLPVRDLLLASFFTIASYLMLTFYDVLAMRYVGQSLPYYKVAMASFIGYTLSHNLGFPLFTGGAARYRLFSAWGLSSFQIAQAIAFSGIVFWLGFIALGGAVLLFSPPPLPPTVDLPYLSLRPLGALCLILVALYFYFFSMRRSPLRLRELEFPPPTVNLSLTGMIIAAVDWVLANNVAYFLLPETKLTYFQFLGLFQLGQIVGLLSHVPGGLGVFEATVLAFLSDKVPASALFASLLAYRVVYYLVPLACSLILMLIHETINYREHVIGLLGGAVRRASAAVPYLMTISMFFCGAFLIFSAATPPIESRFRLLESYLPLAAIEGSHFISALIGIGLILLAHGIREKLDAAYILSAGLLTAGALACLLKGLDYEGALVLIAVLFFLMVNRKHFYRRASLLGQAFEPAWILAIVLLFTATVWLMFFAYKELEYSHGLWWQLNLSGHAPRSMRSTLGALLVASLWGAARLLRSRRPDFEPASPSELALAESVIRKFPHAYANLALLGDKSFIFNETRSAFVMFGIEGRSGVALGDPVGDHQEQAELVWRYREFCDRHDLYCTFYQVHHGNIPLYIDAGLSLIKFGEEALVPLADFSLEGRSRAVLRSNNNKFRREGYSFSMIERGAAAEIMPALKGVSDSWLAARKDQEKGFSSGFFNPDYLGFFQLAVVEHNSQIVAFANVLEAGSNEELSIDMLRSKAEINPGITDFLLAELMLWGREQGYQRFSLGVAPLLNSSDQQKGAPAGRIENLLFHYSEHFYALQSVQAYKEKFEPLWEPRYLASPGGLILPRILANVAALVAAGPGGIFIR